uniref:Uncharacterized protein n=1 Tax=Populus trichocarpa TaxID=3694 RepID=A0A3N7G7J1_POPTR
MVFCIHSNNSSQSNHFFLFYHTTPETNKMKSKTKALNHINPQPITL